MPNAATALARAYHVIRSWPSAPASFDRATMEMRSECQPRAHDTPARSFRCSSLESPTTVRRMFIAAVAVGLRTLGLAAREHERWIYWA